VVDKRDGDGRGSAARAAGPSVARAAELFSPRFESVSTEHSSSGAPAPAVARDRAAVRSFIESFTSQLVQAGFPRTPARIFVALLTSDSSSLTAAELAALLQTSPASVSGGVRYLIQVGLVLAEGEQGTRRQHYRMPANVWQHIVSMRDRLFAQWAADLREGVAVLGPDSPAGAKLEETVRYFEFISGEMAGLLARWDSRRVMAESGEFQPSQ
jgi:predicted transcriptional regulator